MIDKLGLDGLGGASVRKPEAVNKLTTLIEAAKAATPGPWEIQWYHCRASREDLDGEKVTSVGQVMWSVAKNIGPISHEHNHWAGDYVAEPEDAKFIALANPATILELCALLEKAEAAMNSPSGRKYVEALAAIKQWKEQT